MKEFFIELLKGVLLAILYLEITKTNDTNLKNIISFTFYYGVMIFCAMVTNTNLSIVTNAFITKTIFTLIDERVKA